MSYSIYQYIDINHLTGTKIQQTGDKSCSGSSCTSIIVLPIMDTNKSFYIDLNLVYDNGDSNVSVTKVYTKTTGTVLLAVLFLGIFTLIGWFYWPLYIFIVATGTLMSAASFTKGGN